MPTLFHITPASSSVALDSNRQGKATFTVTNASGVQMQARASVSASDASTRGWFRLAEDPEHNYRDGDTTQYTVQINVPADVPAGKASFRLDVVGVENPDEDYTEGPLVQVVVPEIEEPPKPFPWWILAVVGGVLLIGIVLAIVLWPRQTTVPYVLGLPEAAAWSTIEAARLDPVVEEAADPAPIGQAIGTTPEADTKLKRGSEVDLIVSAGQTATPVPTPTSQPTPTRRPPSLVTCVDMDLTQLGGSQRADGTYLLNAGSTSLIFPNADELDQAVTVIKTYRLDQRCFVGLTGSPRQPTRDDFEIEFFLVGGASPSGAVSGEDCIGVNPRALEVQQDGGMWRLLDGRSLLYSSSSKENVEAFQEVIQEYGFTQYCFVGRPDPSMSYLRQ